MSEWVAGMAIVIVALAAAWFDLKERRIPNALTVSALGVALLIALIGGLPSVGASLLGAGICFLLALPFFLVRGLGGGDVKLLVAFGAFLGPTRIAAAMLVTAFVGGAMGLAAMIRQGAVRQTFLNLYAMLSTVGRRALRPKQEGEGHFWVTLDTPGAVTVPYGVAIAAGALYAWFS
jgi:prepilin peptidase CpaA